MLEDPAQKKFEECLRSAAVLAGCTDILEPDGILEDWDVEIKRSLGLCARRGSAVYKPNLEQAAALEFILQTIMPDVEDVAALIMAYRRCGANDKAIKSVQVGWHPVFESDDYRSDPQVIAQLALAEADTNRAFELVLGSIQNISSTGSGWPETPMMQFLLAKLKFQMDELQAASDALQQALVIWPEEPRWQALAAKIHLAQPSDNRLQQLAEAVGYLSRAAAQEPENGAHQLALGQIYLENGQVEQAIQSLEQATRLNPKEPEGWLTLAKAQHLSGNLDQAAISSERAIEGFEDPVDALLLRAEIALQTSNFRGALSRAQTVLRAHPDHPPALYVLSRALEGLNRPAEALAALEQALPIFENPLPMQLARLQLIKRANGLEDGLKALQALVAQNPKQAAYLALLADWLLEAGKQDAAVQAARLALQDGLEGLTLTQRADLHTMIGLHMRKAGQLDQAIHHLSEAIVQSSDHLDAYLELGRVYQDRREYQQALKVYQKAINMAGGDYRPYYQAGLVLKDSKDYMASEAMLRRAAQLAPNEVAVHRLLGAVVALNLVHSHRLIPGDAKGN
jgi:tetratricopeptide (TPR) repeat protein